jgi:hypothetical protein
MSFGCRNKRLHDANDTGIADEHDHAAHIAHRYIADGLPERSDAACGNDNLPLICSTNRNSPAPIGVC